MVKHSTHYMKQQGGVFLGIVIGVLVGLAAALAVAVYVTKVPVPFVNKGQNRTAGQDEAETRKNKDWNPNAPLAGKNPARPASAPEAVTPPAPVATAPTLEAGEAAKAAASAAKAAARTEIKAAAASAAAVAKSTAASEAKPPPARPVSADPLGDLANAKAAIAVGADPFLYFVQAGAFRTPEDAEAQRAKLSLTGLEAKITEREQSGRTVYRVRLGPFEKKDEADRQKEKLEAAGQEAALVRVQR